jgi:hypothetical protein
MTAKTTTEPTAAELDAEYQRLSYAVSQGDHVATISLMKLEDKIDAINRSARREAAAKVEAERLAVAAAKQAAADALAIKEQLHADLLERREAALVEVEAKTKALAEVVAFALIADGDVWAAAMALGYSPETRTASRITNYIGTALGREGAGLGDMPAVFGNLKQPLVTSIHKEQP